MTQSPQSKGGKAAAILFRLKAEHSYYENPNFCLHCAAMIHPIPGQKIQRARRKKFCNSSCAATYNNKRSSKERKPLILECSRCVQPFSFTPYKGAKERRYCDNCKSIAAVESRGDRPTIASTKGDLQRSNKNYQSWRGTIQRHAGSVFSASGKPRACAVCGYSAHVQVAHVRGVATFPPDATILEINTIGNLVALCPNHHWEFDHGLLKLSRPGSGA